MISKEITKRFSKGIAKNISKRIAEGIDGAISEGILKKIADDFFKENGNNLKGICRNNCGRNFQINCRPKGLLIRFANFQKEFLMEVVIANQLAKEFSRVFPKKLPQEYLKISLENLSRSCLNNSRRNYRSISWNNCWTTLKRKSLKGSSTKKNILTKFSDGISKRVFQRNLRRSFRKKSLQNLLLNALSQEFPNESPDEFLEKLH